MRQIVSTLNANNKVRVNIQRSSLSGHSDFQLMPKGEQITANVTNGPG